MRRLGICFGLCAVALLAGCGSAGLLSSWKAPDAQPFHLTGENVGAVVMVNDYSIRLAGEDLLARELSARGARGVPMHSLVPGGAMDETKARAAAEKAGIVGVVVMRPVRIDKELSSRPTPTGPVPPGFWGGYYGYGWGSAWSGGEIRTDTVVVVETLVYSLRDNKLVWSGQSRTTNPSNLNRLVEDTARQVGKELVRQGLIPKASS